MLQLTRDGDTIAVQDVDLEGVANGDPDVSYTIRLLTKQVYREIAGRHTRSRPNRRTHEMEEKTDFDAVAQDLINFVIVSWEGVTDKGEPAPCTAENKQALDGLRSKALMELAGMTQIQRSDATASSFRGTADVL